MRPLPIAVLGASGRVGRLVVEVAEESDDIEVVATVRRGTVGPDCFGDARVVVDFSLPEALEQALQYLGKRALVSGTTGLTANTVAHVVEHANVAPVLTSPNFSTGVALLVDLVERSSRALPDYDIEIVDTHHRHKRDAPSGTALALARAAARGRGLGLREVVIHGRRGDTGERPRAQIAVHALRMGDVVGEHQVWLAGDGDRVLLGHVATSRRAFAEGALRAARWVHGRAPGRYSMGDVLGLEPD